MDFQNKIRSNKLYRSRKYRKNDKYRRCINAFDKAHKIKPREAGRISAR